MYIYLIFSSTHQFFVDYYLCLPIGTILLVIASLHHVTYVSNYIRDLPQFVVTPLLNVLEGTECNIIFVNNHRSGALKVHLFLVPVYIEYAARASVQCDFLFYCHLLLTIEPFVKVLFNNHAHNINDDFINEIRYAQSP